MMKFLLLDAADAAATASDPNASAAGGWMGLLTQFAVLALIVVVFYFLLIRPQKKKDKEVQKMRDSLQVGDEVVTAGGIIGIVVSVKEDTVLLETGNDRSKVRIKRWAIQTNQTIHDDVDEA